MNPYRKIVLPAILFVLILTGVRVAWLAARIVPDAPAAVKGVLDLRAYGLPTHQTLALDGEWEFYPSRLLKQVEPGAEPSLPATYLRVPGFWKQTLPQSGSRSYVFGTYRLRILLPKEDHGVLGIALQSVHQASALYVNGSLLAQSGVPWEEEQGFIPKVGPYSAFFAVPGDELELVIQASADSSIRDYGGIGKTISFGTAMAVHREKSVDLAFQAAILSLVVLCMLLVLLTYFLGNRSRLLLSLMGGLALGLAILLFSDERLGLVLIPLSFGGVVKVTWLLFLAMAAVCFDFIFKLLLPERVGGSYKKIMGAFGIWMVMTAALPVRIVSMLGWLNLIIGMGLLLSILAVILIAIRKGNEDGGYLLLAGSSLLTNMVWSLVETNTTLNMGFYPVDMAVVFLSVSVYALKQYFRRARQVRELALRLQLEDRKKDDFLANTSHELRNPLHGMMNIAQTVLENERSAMGPESARSMELLLTIGGRMTLMLNDLLEQARLREKGVKLQIAPLPLQPLAAGVTDMLAYLAEKKPVRLQTVIPEDFPPVMADEMRLIQILFNLVHNALKSTAEGSVTVSARIVGKEAELEVRDTGIGMDEATAKRVFDAYEQGDSGSGAAGGGFGLGLSISRKLVELHGGELRLRTSPGEGTVFSFRLPPPVWRTRPSNPAGPRCSWWMTIR